MVLGGLYRPKGLALETAKAVLESDKVMAVNVASGCTNGCAYPCYVPLITKSRVMRFPKEAPAFIVKRQLDQMQPEDRPDGVFLSFLTDPFLGVNREATEALVCFLLEDHVKVAVLSKMNVSRFNVRSGMTIVSLDEAFRKRFEPFTPAAACRVEKLLKASREGRFTWVSMEPYPPSALYQQSFSQLLETVSFVDLIVFGKWNYNELANTEAARKEYSFFVQTLRDFCRSNHIRTMIKSDTVRFIQEGSQ